MNIQQPDFNLLKNGSKLAFALDTSVRKHAIEELRTWSMPFRKLMSCYECAIMEVETKFRVLSSAYSVEHDCNPVESIKTRLKSPDSIVEKLIERGLPVTIETMTKELSDIAGIRVICTFPEDVYLLAEEFLKQDDIRLIEKKDYIQNPKPSGYRSLHLIVEVPIFYANEKIPMKAEVQLRTIAMDFWASLEHQIKYKKNVPVSKSEELTQRLKECSDESARLDQTMQDIRRDLQKL